MENTCLCDSGSKPDDCCVPLIRDGKSALNPLQLMRARYYAHKSGILDFIIRTTLPSKQKDIDPTMLKKWLNSCNWISLGIIRWAETGTNKGFVEFKASYLQEGVLKVHHELSYFMKIGGLWYYSHGAYTKAVNQQSQSKNSICFCGSGKKFKRYCWAK